MHADAKHENHYCLVGGVVPSRFNMAMLGIFLIHLFVNQIRRKRVSAVASSQKHAQDCLFMGRA